MEEHAEHSNPNPNPNESRQFYVYLLESSIKKATYVGATVDIHRRLRQHNKEICGGAHATGARVTRGEVWRRVCYVTGFPTWQAALQFEWRFKQISRRLPKTLTPVERRTQALSMLLALDRSTTKAIPYAEWPSAPQVIWECEEDGMEKAEEGLECQY